MDNLTAFLAWWGAAISTAVLVWDVYKWRKTGRPELKVRAHGDMQDAHSNNPQKYVVIHVTNTGDKPTTLSSISFRYYKRKPRKWLKTVSDKRGIFLEPIRATAELPYKLDVGAEWSCLVYQSEEIEQMVRDGFFYIEADDSSTSNAVKNARTRLLLE